MRRTSEIAVGMDAGRGEAEDARRRPRYRRPAAAGRARPRRRRSPRGRSRLSAYMPGISAVSPPISAQPACRQPSAMPSTMAVALARIELAGGEIVEEEQRLGALHDEVVDAHGDEVDADRVVHARSRWRSSAWCRRRHWRRPAPDRRSRRPSGRTGRRTRRSRHRRRAARVERTMRLDRVDEIVAGVDVDARVAIGQWSRFGHGSPHRFRSS